MSDKELKFEIKPEIAEGDYSNLAVVHNSASEFVIDFAKVLPGAESAMVSSRIILSPLHAKRLLKSLNSNVAMYEKQQGTIQDFDQPVQSIKTQGNA